MSMVKAAVNYQSAAIKSSLRTTREIYVDRGTIRPDPVPVGIDTVPVEVSIKNARDLGMTIDKNGFTMTPHVYDHVNYYDDAEVMSTYYSECCRLVQKMTGAKRVFAFDHNIRSSAKSGWMKGPEDGAKAVPVKEVVGGNQVQTPVALVHNDYTLTSAPKRVKDLSEAPRINDTLRKVLGETPLFSQNDLAEIEGNRYVFINVWRNIADVPVRDMPLAMCDAQTFSTEDLVTFEIRYPDRTGENYFVKHSPKHDWVYYPEVTKDEAILLKVWDSHGAIMGAETPNMSDEEKAKFVPASFSFHTAFQDPTATADCPKRESIECRLIAVY